MNTDISWGDRFEATRVVVEQGPKNATPWLLNSLYARRKTLLASMARAKKSGYRKPPMSTAAGLLLMLDREAVKDIEDVIASIEARQLF